MNTKIVSITEDNIDPSLIKEAGEIIKRGGLVAFPTETVYGLGGDALNADSSKKIYAAKGRPSDNPLIVHIYRLEDLDYIVKEVPEKNNVLGLYNDRKKFEYLNQGIKSFEDLKNIFSAGKKREKEGKKEKKKEMKKDKQKENDDIIVGEKEVAFLLDRSEGAHV